MTNDNNGQQGAKRVRAASNGAPVVPRVAQRKAPTYSMARFGNVASLRNSDDFTIKREANVSLVRPNYYGKPLIFRMLPALNPEKPTEFAPYCDSSTGEFSDVIRAYPVVRSIGTNEKYSFLLYNPEWSNYDPRTNPYQAIYNRVYRAVKIERDFPRFRGVRPEEWLTYIERTAGKPPAITKPTSAFYCRAIIFANSDNVYVGRDRSPRGLGDRDLPQIVQLPVSAGQMLWDAMMLTNDSYTGPMGNWEQSMFHGDLVHPAFGRFITVAGKQGRGEVADDDLDYTVGASSGRDGGQQKTSFSGEGYTISIDRNLILNGKETRITAQLRKEAIPLLIKRAVWFDDIFHFPDHDQICAYCAMAYQHKPHILQYGWEDHPEYFTDEVKRILKNAKTVPAGAIPGDEDADTYSDADQDKPRRSSVETAAVVPANDDYYANEANFERDDLPTEQATEAAGYDAQGYGEVDEPAEGSASDDAYAPDPGEMTSGQESDPGAAYAVDEYDDDEDEPAEDDEDSADAEASDSGYADIQDETDAVPSAQDDVEAKMAAARAAAARRSSMRNGQTGPMPGPNRRPR